MSKILIESIMESWLNFFQDSIMDLTPSQREKFLSLFKETETAYNNLLKENSYLLNGKNIHLVKAMDVSVGMKIKHPLMKKAEEVVKIEKNNSYLTIVTKSSEISCKPETIFIKFGGS
jgi:hypothetical protein